MELLVVIAIMAIIMGITVPAFNTMGKGSGMRGAISQLRSTISLSRQWAITHRQPVYIIFPDFDLTDFHGDAQEFEKACKAYAVYAITNNAKIEDNDISALGEYITDWKFLPKDVVFLNDEDIKRTIFDEDKNMVRKVKLKTGGQTETVYTLICNPDGSAGILGAIFGGLRIPLAEGYMIVYTNDLSASEYEPKYEQAQSVAIHGLTGGIVVEGIDD